jgi:hypothetical protein
MFIPVKLNCGIEIMINPACVASCTFNGEEVKIELSTGRVINFPLAESGKIRKGLEAGINFPP